MKQELFRTFALAYFLLLTVALTSREGVVATETHANQTIAIRCGRLIDGKSAGAISNAVILIEGDRITAVGRDLKIPKGAQVIDLSHATVLPGLIDTHTHLTYHYDTQRNES